jgi:hypothetical protein
MYTAGCGLFADGDIDIDANAIVSESTNGAWVAAWVWVPRDALRRTARRTR